MFKMFYLFFYTILMTTLTIATLNVRSVRSPIRAQSILSFLSTFPADMFLLQECAIPFLKNYNKWAEEWPHGPSMWSGSNSNKADGVALLVKNPHVLVKGSTVVRDGRILLIKASFLGREFKVLNIYGHTEKNDRYDLFKEAQSHLLGRKPTILAGDFNCVINKEDRRGAGENFREDKTSFLLRDLVKDFKLTDAYKTMHPGKCGYTWFSGDDTKASRIDYVFFRDLGLEDARLTPLFFSDHSMLSCTFSLPPGVTIGKGLWKLNCSLLEDKSIVKGYKEQYCKWQTLQDFFESRAQWWEMVKGRTQTYFKQAGRKKKEKEKRQMVGLQRRLQRYFDFRNQGLDFNDEIKEVQKEMLKIAERESKGIILRSKERNIEEGEKCTRYFFKKILNKSGAIIKLKNTKGEEKTKTEDILEIVEDFYEELYKEKVTENEVLKEVLTFIEKTIKDGTSLNKDFVPFELDKVLKNFKKGKTPGADGLPLEFYETFWDILKQDLMTVFNDLDDLDSLPDSFRLGIMTLLYKKNDKTDLKNWRPITLLNMDCKIFSKLLTTRMSTFLTDLIHPDQACAVPGRKITDSLVLIRDVICHARDRNIRLLALNLDFEKAFDRVSQRYLFQVLEKMGFPGRFLKWVGLLYSDITSKILINGNLSKAIKICSGVRQGCPLSPLLYVAGIEPLAQVLRRDVWIKGLTIPGTRGLTAKTVLYMDDINLLCTDIVSVRRTMDITDWFGRAAGARLNRDKTRIQFFGPWERSEIDNVTDIRHETDLKILGVNFDKDGGGNGNWEELMKKTRQRLSFWGLRNLTLEGKILIIKAMILSLFLLVCSVFIPPRPLFLALDRAIFHFLWGSGWERLRREEMKRATRNGGKGVPDMNLFLGAKYTALHIKYATSVSSHKTVALARYGMGSFLRAKRMLPVDQTVPLAFHPPPAYAFITKFLRRFKLENEKMEILTNHRAMISIVQGREQVCPIKGLSLVEAKRVWHNVSHPALRNRHRDLAWMAAHEILPVRAVMHSRGMSKNQLCPRPGCGRPETVRHALWECSVVRNLWAKAGPQQFPYLPPGGVPDYRTTLTGEVSQEGMPAQLLTATWLTINCIKDAIWTSRNLVVGKRMQVSVHSIIQLAKYRLQEYTAWRYSDEGVRASHEKVSTATDPDCP